MDTNRVRKPHLCGNTMEFYQRNGNQRRHYHSKLQGSRSVTYTYSDPYGNAMSARIALADGGLCQHCRLPHYHQR